MKLPLLAASAALGAALFATPTATPRQQATTGPREAARGTPGTSNAGIPIGSVAELARARAAIEAAERGTPDDAPLPASHPLAGWAEYAGLRRRIDTLPTSVADDFLKRHSGDAVGETFREQWLAALAKREDWPTFRAAWAPTVKSAALRCTNLNARQALGQTDDAWTNDAQALWRANGKSLPNECDAPMAVLASRDGLPASLRWERIEKAAAEWQPAVMRAAARGLPAEEFALANDYAAFIESPHDRALAWPKTARSRLIASHGLARQAKASPRSVDAQVPKFTEALGLNDVERGRALYQAALWTVASYEPDSAWRLNAVPDVAYDDKLHEWRVREAMARSDWKAALAAIRKMGDKQRRDSRWRYFEARLLEIDGDKANARILYADAATRPEFHGFLAADRIAAPYALCPIEPKADFAAKSAVARDPAIQRAMQLYRIERGTWAEREWSEALSRFTPEQRIHAVDIAQDNGWFDRGVFGLVNVGGKSYPDESRLYHLRFPLHHDAVIRREAAKHGIDPTWVAAEIRAESVFNPKARSHADARGLMQVLPSTGAGIAKRLGLPWRGGDSLYEPEFNIQLGTAYLRELEDKYGMTYVAIAAYNAGPAPVARWQSQRPGMDADFWIETISYKETRDYVARILAFSVIYDWRLNRAAMPITDRLAGRIVDTRKPFACPLPPDLPAPPATAAPAAPTKPASAPARSRGKPRADR